MDSLSTVELIISIEEKTGVSIDPLEAQREDFNTLNKVVQYVIKKRES